MPTLDLYETPAHPDAWHHVIAPGGYEWWCFRANEASGVQFTIDFFDGNPFHPDYRNAYERFRRRPTRTIPPLPRDYSAVRLTRSENGKQLWRGETNLPPNSVQESADPLRVSIGPYSFQVNSNGTFRLQLEPIFQQGNKPGPRVDLTFAPVTPVPSRQWQVESKIQSIAHLQLVGSPKYEVSGTIQEADGVRTLFAGRGEYEHRFGTGPFPA